MKPLLLVHGISSNARETFGAPGRFGGRTVPGGMIDSLIRNGYAPGKDLFWFDYPTLRPVSESARRLRDEITRVQQASGSKTLDILTFSLGGIISKYYLVSPAFGGEVRKLIMIAPPFLGSPWANWFKVWLIPNRADQLFPGDGKALTPQILTTGNPFLTALSRTPFPETVETTIIALKTTVPDERRDLFAAYVRWLDGWLGEGDLVVPVGSTKVATNHHFEVADELALRVVHKFLPRHPRVQELVRKQLE